jgi:type I restriction enzyme, S subunit
MAKFERKPLGMLLGERGYIRGPFGSALVRKEMLAEGVPVYEQQHAISDTREFRYFVSEAKFEELSRFQVMPNDLIISCSGTVGRISIIRPGDPQGIISQALLILRPQASDLSPEFLFYFLSTHEGQHAITQASHGSVQTNIAPRAVVEQIEVPVPSIHEQRAIAHILGTLDDKIELNRRMSRTLEEIARALFTSWFVDFDPVRAKAEGRDPGLPPHIAALFPDSFEDSELGEIPAGWRVLSLSQVFEVNPQRTLTKGEEAPYLGMASMPTQGHSPDEVTTRPFGSGMRFINGDTLVARITPCLENGKTAFVDFLEDGQVGWGSTEYIVMRPKPPLPEEFAYCLARSDQFREFAIQNMTGTSGRQRVSGVALSHFYLAAPAEAVAEQFGQIVKPLFARARTAVDEASTLSAARDVLLPKLISGELPLENAEHFVEEATG